MKITGKIAADDSFEFTLEEHGSTHFVTIGGCGRPLSFDDRQLLDGVAWLLGQAAAQLTKATVS